MDNVTYRTDAILDLSEDLILSADDAIELIQKFEQENIRAPHAIWLNRNQAYVLAKILLRSTDRFTGSDADLRTTAESIDSFGGITVYLKGRDTPPVIA